MQTDTKLCLSSYMNVVSDIVVVVVVAVAGMGGSNDMFDKERRQRNPSTCY